MSSDPVQNFPILLSIPHASVTIPEEVSEYVALSADDILWYSDCYTDELYRIEGFPIVEAKVARIFLDVNRAPDDLSKEHKQAAGGSTVLRAFDGKPVYTEEPPPEVMSSLIDRYHNDFHDEVDAHIPHARFLIDCHSYFPAEAEALHGEQSQWPDFNIGNMHYATCTRQHTMFFRDFLQDRGYNVDINFPYSGKYVIGHHCHRRRIPPFLVPGVQLEINEELYRKKDSLDVLPGRIEELNNLLKNLTDALIQQFGLNDA